MEAIENVDGQAVSTMPLSCSSFSSSSSDTSYDDDYKLHGGRDITLMQDVTDVVCFPEDRIRLCENRQTERRNPDEQEALGLKDSKPVHEKIKPKKDESSVEECLISPETKTEAETEVAAAAAATAVQFPPSLESLRVKIQDLLAERDELQQQVKDLREVEKQGGRQRIPSPLSHRQHKQTQHNFDLDEKKGREEKEKAEGEQALNIVVLGPRGSGKTCFISNLIKLASDPRNFSPSSSSSSAMSPPRGKGPQGCSWEIKTDLSVKVKLIFHESKEDKRWRGDYLDRRRVAPHCVHGVIFICDITSEESVNEACETKQALWQNGPPSILIVNKTDLLTDVHEGFMIGAKMHRQAKNYNFSKWFICSSKWGEGVSEAIEFLTPLALKFSRDCEQKANERKIKRDLERLYDRILLNKGSLFIKYDRFGRPSHRMVWVSSDQQSLCWGRTRTEMSKTFPICYIKDIIETPLFTAETSTDDCNRSLTLVMDQDKTDRQSIQLVAYNDVSRWTNFLQRVRLQQEKVRLEQEKDSKPVPPPRSTSRHKSVNNVTRRSSYFVKSTVCGSSATGLDVE